MRDNLKHAVFATLLIIWRRIARTPSASTVTVLVTYPNNVLLMLNAVYVRRRVTRPLIANCRGLGAYLHIALRTLLLSLLRIILAMIMKLLATSDNDLSSVMDVQRQEDGDVPASISNVHDDDDDDDDDHDDSGDDDDDDDDDDDAGVDDDDTDANNVNDDVAADDNNDMDDGDSCDEIVVRLHDDYDESEEDPILGPRKRPREDDGSPDLFSKSPCPQDSGSLQSLQKTQVPPVSPSEAPT